MSTADNGGPAFPVLNDDHHMVANMDAGKRLAEGMSLRDYFAAKALQGFCANPAVFAANPLSGWSLVNSTESQLSEYCLVLADMMIAERAK